MTLNTKTLTKLGQQSVIDENGQATILSSFWKDKRVVLVFIRHFG